MISTKLKPNKFASLITRLTGICMIVMLMLVATGCSMFDNQQTSTLPQDVDSSNTTSDESTSTEITNDEKDGEDESPALSYEDLEGTILEQPLLEYLERSNMQIDESAMSEVATAVTYASYDESVYGEILAHSIDGNVSCYIDQDEESKLNVDKITYDEIFYYYNDASRTLDQVPYYAAGNMYGMTITFKPFIKDGVATYKLEDGIINMFASNGETRLKDCPLLYEAIQCKTVELISKAYANSDYTVFIRMYKESSDRAGMIVSYGQFNGVSLKMIDDMVRVAGD